MKAPNLDGLPDAPGTLPIFSAPERICIHDVDLFSPEMLYVGRRSDRRQLEGSKWHNPYRLTQYSRAKCLEHFRSHLEQDADLRSQLAELSGRKLVCWCPMQLD